MHKLYMYDTCTIDAVALSKTVICIILCDDLAYLDKLETFKSTGKKYLEMFKPVYVKKKQKGCWRDYISIKWRGHLQSFLLMSLSSKHFKKKIVWVYEWTITIIFKCKTWRGWWRKWGWEKEAAIGFWRSFWMRKALKVATVQSARRNAFQIQWVGSTVIRFIWHQQNCMSRSQ